jgi:lysophospholipase L1-like esterase
MRSRVALLLLVAVPLAVAIVAAELYLRRSAARAREALRATFDARELCTERSPDRRLLYTYRGGECGANSRGFRDREHAPEKPDSTYRIVLIGDSVAEGRDVDPDSAFGRVLERSLNAQSAGYRYEVILLARIGYSTSQEIVLLHTEAFRYHPDLILWSYCLNDPAHPVYHNANGALGQYYYRPRSYVVHLFRRGWFGANQSLAGRDCPREFHAFLHCAFWKDVAANLHRIAGLAGAQRVPVMLIVHPVFEEKPSFDDYALADVHARLAEAARLEGIETVDLLDAFRAYAPAALKLHRDDWFDPWHLNENGHRVTANFILDRLTVTGPGL